VKDARIAQITDSEQQKIERDLRNKIQHLETEIKIYSGFGNTDFQPEEMDAKEDALALFNSELKELESRKIQATIEYQGRVTIELSPTDGFYLFIEEDGNVDRGKYWQIEWGVKQEVDLLDAELQQVMDYFNIDDTTYKIRG
jgi:transposase